MMQRYELFLTTDQSIKLKTRDGEVISHLSANFDKVGLRKFSGNEVFDFNYYGQIENRKFIENCKPQSGLGLPLDFKPLEFNTKSWKAPGFNPKTIEHFGAQVKAAEGLMDLHRDRFAFSGSFDFHRIEVSLEDSNGEVLKADFNSSTNWYSIKRLGSATIHDAVIWSKSDKLNLDFFATCAARTLSHYDVPAQLPKDGKYPVLFAHSWSAEDSFLRLIQESLVADKYHSGGGLLSGMLGHKVFSEAFSIVDSSQRSDLGVFNPFDGEGFVRNEPDLILVENGVVKNLIANQSLAAKYQTKATGNGIKTFDSAPLTRFHSVQIKPGTQSTQELLKSLPVSVVVMMAGGGDFTDIGDYAEPVEFAYLLEFGEVVGRLPALTLKSRVQDMFGADLIAIAKDNYFNSSCSPSVIMSMQVMKN